jgi:hypothetical protein
MLACLMGIALGCAPTFQTAARSARPSIVQVGPPEVVLSANERPYSWPDGTMGILQDDLEYRFFAASAGFPKVTAGSLQNPISNDIRDLKIEGLKKRYDYVAGGPIYRDDASGCLLMFYHAEVFTFPPGYLPFYSEIGLARSLDGGKTWSDLGAFLTPHTPIDAPYFQKETGILDVGWGAYAIVGEYFYVYFNDLLSEDQRYRPISHAVVRARIDDVVRAATEQGAVSSWAKYHEGRWKEPGLGGKSSPLIEHGRQSFILGDVSYNRSLRKYVAVFMGEPWPNSDLYWAESVDGLRWSNYRKIVDDPGHQYYVTLVGTGDEPRQSGESFYIYYVDSLEFERTGDRNKDGKLVRRLITVY